MSLSVDVRHRRGTFVVEAAFEASPGTTVALLGPNGAGKSTLVSLLAGIDVPEQGRIDLDREALDDTVSGRHVPPERRPIGVVFQDGLLFPHLTAAENVAFPLRARGLPRRESLGRAEELLERLGMADRMVARPGELSGGEAQRVALARALVHHPRLLLLDEPLSGLDVRSRAHLRTLIRRELLAFPGIRLLVTHDPVEAMTMADTLVLMEDGRVTQIGTPADVRANPRTGYGAELVGVNLFAGRLEPVETGVGRIVTSDGHVVAALPHGLVASGEDTLGLVRPADVSIHVRPPEGGSARNVFRGTVDAVVIEGDRARVRVASSPPVLAEITMGSVERLGIREGLQVWASFKAVEVHFVTA
jgi:molybdate transport system ATP-binding protein